MHARFWNRALAAILTGALIAAGALVLLAQAWTPAQASQQPGSVSPSAARQTLGPDASAVITVGVAAPLSGGVAFIGWPLANSVQLAISQTNAAGGINVAGITYTLALVMADDKCNATVAITAANTLLSAGAVAVVGHACSSASLAAQPIYFAAGVPMVSPISTIPILTQQGYTTTFRTIAQDGAPAARLAMYLRDWGGIATSAIVDGSSRTAGDVYSSTLTALGATITSRRTVTNAGDFPAVLSAIQSENPDAIFYSGTDASDAGLFSQNAYGLGMTNVTIAWHSGSEDESLLTAYSSAAGPAAVQGDLAAMSHQRTANMPGWPDFLAAYQAANFAHEPSSPGIIGPFSHDAANIIFAAMGRAASVDPGAIRDEIAATEDWHGVVGTYRGFDGHGDVIPQWGWLVRSQGGQWTVLNPSKVYLPITLKN